MNGVCRGGTEANNINCSSVADSFTDSRSSEEIPDLFGRGSQSNIFG
jgi:hypothetical protein